ncbi:YncE family protein [Streptomyces sp. NPDC049040]|uniref:YncE family protein n=1 Tax=Streptomyces sp. NPDC049040 TaxID=3365593 RepID=UPI00370F7D8E
MDGALHRVFVGDHASGRITATDYSGAVVDSVGGVSGVTDLTLSQDGSVLYAAAAGSHQIVALQAATLDVKTRYPVATDTGPSHVAFAAGKVWFTYGDQWSGDLGSVDPSIDPSATRSATSAAAGSATAEPSQSPDPVPTVTPTADPPAPDPTTTDNPAPDPTVTPTEAPTSPGDPTPDPTVTPTAEPTADPTPSDNPTPDPTGTPTPDPTPANPVTLGQFPGPAPGIWGAGILDTDPSAPGLLAIGETGLSTDSMAVVDVSGATPTSTAWYFGDYSLNSGVVDLDLVPGSSRQVLVNGSQRDSYANGKFSATGAYPAAQRADIAPDGLVAQVSGTTVAVYRPNATQPLRKYTLGGTGAVELAWAPDSSRIFTVVKSGSGYTLQVLTDPTKNVPTLTVAAPATAVRGKALTVTGKLSSTVAGTAGATLQVTRVDMESPGGKVLAAVHPKSDGSYAFTDTPPAGGNVTYTVRYPGDTGHIAVSASDTVAVSRVTPALTLNNNGSVYSYGKSVVFTAHLGTTYTNRTVEIWADPYGTDRPNVLLRSGKVDSHGNLSVALAMNRDATVTAAFKGDARYAPKAVKSTAYALARVSTALSRYYKTGKIGSTAYYYFHKNTDVISTTSMTYYKGREQYLQLEVYYKGKWYAGGSGYFPLATNGRSAVNLGHAGESGIRARVRAAYINGSSGDVINTTTYTSWKYFIFV